MSDDRISRNIEALLFSRPEVRDAMMSMVMAIDPEASDEDRMIGLTHLAELFNSSPGAAAVGGALVSLAGGYIETEEGQHMAAVIRATVRKHALRDGAQ